MSRYGWTIRLHSISDPHSILSVWPLLYTFMYPARWHKWLDEVYCSFSAVFHAPHLQWYIPPSCSVRELRTIRIKHDVLYFLFLQGDPGDPLTMSFSRIWRNSESHGAREADGRVKAMSWRSPRGRGRTFSPLNVATWRSSSRATLRTFFASHLPTRSPLNANHHLTSQLEANKLIFIPNIWKQEVLCIICDKRVNHFNSLIHIFMQNQHRRFKTFGQKCGFPLTCQELVWLMSAQSII